MRRLTSIGRTMTDTPQKKDILWLTMSIVVVWLVIERTEACDRFFDWVAENPDLEIDSAILAFILAAVGITIYAVRRTGEMKRAENDRCAAENRFQTLAYYDPLTGLQNRQALCELLDDSCQSAGQDSRFALIMIDLDRFKGVNDLHGHRSGDRLLRQVATRIEKWLSPSQHCFRLGGDEFAIMAKLAESEGEKSITRLAGRIITELSDPFHDENLVHHIGASVGISYFPGNATDREGLSRAADVALYRAKDAGRGRYCSYHPSMDERLRRRARLENEMRAAIPKRAFVPFYQPLVCLNTGEATGFELLARWDRNDGEFVGPDEFIPVAEECGLINDVLFSILTQACEDAREWDPELTIAVNISPVQFKDPWLSEKVLALLARKGFAPQRLSIEVTENALITDEDNARRTITSFKNQGMQISLDDFGTGYSSLHHLHMLPFNKIKIDRSFVMGIETNREAFRIVKAIVGLAHSLDLPVVAEGIETAEAARILNELGCQQGQGHHFGKPICGNAVTRALGQNNPLLWLKDPSRETAGKLRATARHIN